MEKLHFSSKSFFNNPHALLYQHEVKPGVYYYVVKVTFKDGEVRERAGSVHLIR